jgi:hypothetical protein
VPFQNTNRAVGLPPNSPFQQGVNNIDDGSLAERDVFLPSPTDPAGCYVYFECTVGVMLDSGIVVHNRLPQVNRAPDTLSTADYADDKLDSILARDGFGVNLRCQDQYADIVQRMGHARYWFRLWGWALRVGYQVPIPGIKTIGGAPAIPYDRNPQWAFNRIAPGGNYGGLTLWHAVWSLWYTTAVPPTSSALPANDCAAHVTSKAAIPTSGILPPLSGPDDSAQLSGAPQQQQQGRLQGGTVLRGPNQ